MTQTIEILMNYVLYHEWLTNEQVKVIESSNLISEEMLPYLYNILDTYNFWLSVLYEKKIAIEGYGKTVKELTSVLTSYHEMWKNLISSLGKEDLSRLIKYTNTSGLIKTHSLIDLIMESFRLIENNHSFISAALENNYRKRLNLGYLDYRQRINL